MNKDRWNGKQNTSQSTNIIATRLWSGTVVSYQSNLSEGVALAQALKEFPAALGWEVGIIHGK